MRFLSLLLAIVVATGLYFWVIERERTLEFLTQAQSDDSPKALELAQETAQPKADKVAVPGDDLIRVVVRKSTARDIDNAVILRGQTQAARQVEVRAETSSTVVSAPLRKGSFVEPGQLMCELSAGTRASSLAEARARLAEAIARKTEAESRVPEAESRVVEAQARIDEALVNQNAARRLSEGGFAAETRVKNTDAALAAAEAGLEGAKAGVTAAKSGLESADATIESAEAAIATAEKELERLQIRAPFGGLLESDTAELGTLLQPGSLCATIIQLDPIKLVAFAPETEVSRIMVGAKARARLAAGGPEVAGDVTFLSRAADQTTRTFRVEIDVANSELAIRDGQTAEIAISATGDKAHLLPPSAMTLNEEGTLGLRTIDEAGVVAFSPATVVKDTAQGVWLTGLPDTLNVIVVGQEFVTAGVKVAPTFEEQTQ